ncbi:MAG: LLM class flavin-dependent oxidoreductase [Actinomycetota bacterium]|nr:LLM class flavin-dependent oxidoreductase [Actinomycetota bacterium]
MATAHKIGAFISPAKTFDDGVERVKAVEDLGYSSVWVPQIADREATITIAAYAMATSRINLGTGVLPTYPRTPVVMAQTAASLDELSGGRFILGVGPSHKVTIEMWHDMSIDKPIASTREYVGAVRAILAGETFFGDIYKTAFSFTGYKPVRPNLPIYISCLSPKMCALAGEIADGAVLWMCSPAYIEKVVVPKIAEGRAKVGKTMDDFEVVAAVPVALTDNPAGARDAFRKVSVVYWNLPFYRNAIEAGGFAADLERFDKEGPSGISDEAIDTMAGIGSVQECSQVVASYRAAGTTTPGISILPRHEGTSTPIETFTALAGA